MMFQKEQQLVGMWSDHAVWNLIFVLQQHWIKCTFFLKYRSKRAVKIIAVIFPENSIIIRLEAKLHSSAEYWIRFTAHFGGVHAFGYNSAKSESYLDEIWSTLSRLSGAGPGRFCVRSAK